MKAANWIDKLKDAHGWESDYRVAKELGVRPQTVSNYRTRDSTLDDQMAMKVAQLLGLNPALVMADQAAERTKDEGVRSAWTSILKILLPKEKAPVLAGAVIGGEGGIRTHGTLRYA